MTISVVIPTYNGEKYIEECINSVLDQTRTADEIIISDDNSSDNTIRKCEKYGDRLKIIRNPDGPSGFVNGWNNAIALATKDYVSILHQDDLLDKDFLKEIEAAHEKYPYVQHLVSCCKYIDGTGETKRVSKHCDGQTRLYTGKEYCDKYVMAGGDHINRCPGVVTKRSLFEKCTYREEAGHIADDDFFMRVGNYTDVICIHKPLAAYREHSGSETGHLDYLQINMRLLKCHSFLIDNFTDNKCLSEEAKEYIRIEEGKYYRRVIIKSIATYNLRYLVNSLKLLFRTLCKDRWETIHYLIKREHRF